MGYLVAPPLAWEPPMPGSAQPSGSNRLAEADRRQVGAQPSDVLVEEAAPLVLDRPATLSRHDPPNVLALLDQLREVHAGGVGTVNDGLALGQPSCSLLCHEQEV